MPLGAHRDRVKKTRHDESGPSGTAPGSGRALRPRKRGPSNDEIERVNANTESENDTESNPEYVAQTRSGHRLGEDDDVESDGGHGGGNPADDGSDDDDESDHGGDGGNVGMPTPHMPFYAFGGTLVDYAKDRITDAVKQNRCIDPYVSPKHGGDPRFWNKFQQDFYALVIYKKRPYSMM